MRNLGAWVVLCSAAAWAIGCGGSAPAASDGAAQHDTGSDVGSDAGSAGDTGTGDDGGTTDGGCESDPACTAAGPRCDPTGTDLLGECVDVGGCLELQGLAACPSTLQTCPVGASACACPTASCNTEVDTACGIDGTVVACRLDVEGGCGVYPESGGQSCPGHQSCHGSPPTAACACDGSDCTGAGLQCSNDASAVITCQLDGVCPYVASTSPCASPKVCQGTPPTVACACPPAGSDTRIGRGCTTLGTKACDADTGNINECVLDSVSGCQLWQLAAGTTCTAQQLACGTQSGAPACQCPTNTTGVFYADAFNGSPAGGMPFPTGVLTPTQCRYKLLTPALAASQTWVMSHPSAEVRATGQVNISVMHFAEPAYPLVVPPDVTLTTTDSPLDPSHYVIDFAQAGASAAVRLGSGASFKGFTIQNLVAAATSADGVVTSTTCSANTTVTLESVRVEGEATPNRLRHGVAITGAPPGSCDASLTDVTVRSVSQAGLFVQSTRTDATTRVTGSLFDGNGNGVRALRGTVELDSVSVTNSGAEGILVRPTGGDTLVSGVAGDVTGSHREGVRVEAGTGATSASLVALTGTVVSSNGANGSVNYPGLAVLARTARLLGVNVHDNAGGGLQTTGAGTVVTIDLDAGNAAHFDSNWMDTSAPPGVYVGDGATVSATGATANANRGPGVRLTGGASAVTLHGCQIDGNGLAGHGPGLEVSGGTLVVDGQSVVSNNRGEGIREYAGSVSLNGTNLVPVVVQNNGLDEVYSGVRIGQGQTDTAFSANYAEFRDNTEHGVYVFNRNLQNQGGPIDIVNCTFIDNVSVGLFVTTSMPSSTGTRTLNVTKNSFLGGNRGIQLEAGSGDIWGTVQGNSITKASYTGLVLHGTAASALTIAHNQISENSAVSPMPPGRSAGGVVVDGTAPAAFAFFGNAVHHNDFDQVLVAGNGTASTTWSLGGASCAANEYNTFACYNSQLPAGAYFGLVVVGPITVNATNESWQPHAAPPSPQPGVDYLIQGGGTVTITASCADSTLACP